MRKLTQDEYKLSFAILGLGILFYFAYLGYIDHQQKNTESARKTELALSASRLFNEEPLSAKAAYVYDATDSVTLFALNENASLPLASLTKVMTALIAKRDIPQTEKIYISANALSEFGDTGLKAGDAWKASDLIRLMLISSSNDAATAIREYVDEKRGAGTFIRAMNDYARDIGLTHTTFYNESGLDGSGTPGAIGTAADVARLFLLALRDAPEILVATTKSDIVFTSATGATTHVENTNNLSTYVDDLLASKTGYTTLAGGNLGIIFRVPVYGHQIVAVVLASTQEARFTDMKFLIGATTEYFKKAQ